MTTIAIDSNLVMASDSRMTNMDEIMQQPATKIFQVHGHTIGIAGAYGQAQAFIQAFEDMLERQRVQSTTYIEIPQGLNAEDLTKFSAIVVTPENEVFLFEGSRFSFPIEVPFAIGSGSPYAMSAMVLGFNAPTAVEHAIKFDPYSGGEVVVVEHGVSNEPEKPTIDIEELKALPKKKIIEKLESLIPSE